MSDIQHYAEKRARRDQAFAKNLETGYTEFKIGIILRQAREEAALTQEEVARQLRTNRSTISCIENHAGDVQLSALRRYAEAVGADLQINFVRG